MAHLSITVIITDYIISWLFDFVNRKIKIFIDFFIFNDIMLSDLPKAYSAFIERTSQMASSPNYKRTLRACYLGYITQAIVNNLSPLFFAIFHTDFGISLSLLGTLVLINFVTQLLIDLLAAKFGNHFTYRQLMVTAHFANVAGLVALSILPGIMPAYTGLIIATVLNAVGGGLAEVVVSPTVDALPSDCKEASMSLLHSFYCWGQLLTVAGTTLVLKMIGSSNWRIIPLLWALIPLFNAFNFMKVPLIEPEADAENGTVKHLFRHKFFYMIMIMMLCGGAAELTVSQWSSLFAEKGLAISKVVGDLLGPGLFAIFMGTGRMLYGIFGSKINLRSALIGCSALGVVCYLATAFVPNAFLSLIACAMTGLAVSLMWPGSLSVASAEFPRGGTSMFAILALCGDFGCSLGPWLAGIVSDSAGKNEGIISFAAKLGIDAESAALRSGIAVGTVFPLLLLLLLICTAKKKKQNT